MRLNELPQFIFTMYQERSEDDLKANWLSNPFREGTFNDYKEKVIKSYDDGRKSKVQIEVESQTAMNEALSLLDSLGGAGDGG